MIYTYECEHCKTKVDITKSMKDATRKEFCNCGREMRRVFNPLGVTWADNCWDYDKEGLGDNFCLRHHA
jgi:putative FmdB family regulatory protein